MAAPSPATKRKIAILGGGMGALSAAYALTSQPGWREQMSVTVYQRGWRLGGKAASGRNMGQHGRIEEHGMHVWSGCFTHAVATMQDCYREMARLGLRQAEAPLGTFDKAFKPLNHLFVPETVMEPDGSMQVEPWRIDAPATEIEANVADHPAALSPQICLDRLLDLLANVMAEAGGDPACLSPSPSCASATTASARAWVQQAQQAPEAAGHAQRRRLTLLDLGLATARGLVEDQVLAKGFDHLDQWDGRAWLARHGASKAALESTAIAAAYGFAFGYPGSLSDHRGIGAGTLLRSLFRLAFANQGALFLKMQASAGDAVFAPLYQVLAARGVQFRFFHAVSGLHLNADHTAITAISLVEQARPLTTYQPLVTVRNLASWPTLPLWQQLQDSVRLEATKPDFEDESCLPEGTDIRLHRGEDFDDVILGIPPGALSQFTPELTQASPAWRAMLGGVETTAIQTMQLWLTVPSAEYGWKQLVDAHNQDTPSGNAPLRSLTAGLAGSVAAWADISDLLARADWGFDDRPWSAAAITAPVSDAAIDASPTETQAYWAEWLNTCLGHYWPNMRTSEGGFLHSTLHDPEGREGSDRLGWQYFWTGVHGSARQVLSVPGSLELRLESGASGFSNLALAGDWTRNGINNASAESAVLSGIQAAAALTGALWPAASTG